jgi:hypothetical protein
MADYVVQESDGTSKFTLEDASGAILIELQSAAAEGIPSLVMAPMRQAA